MNINSVSLGVICLFCLGLVSCHKKQPVSSVQLEPKTAERSPAALKPLSGPGFEWKLAKANLFKENKMTLVEIQKTPSILPFDEFIYDQNSSQFVGSSKKNRQIKPFPVLNFEFEKQKVELTLKTVLQGTGEKILILKVGEKSQELLKFDTQKWTLTISWAGDLNHDHKLDVVLALGNVNNWMTAVATSQNSEVDKNNLVSLESFQRENPGHGD